MKRINTAFLLMLFISGIIIGQAASPQKPAINAVKIDKPINLTGKIDDPEWALAQPVELKYEIMPGENIPAPQRTVVRALYDDKNVYFAFKCYDTDPGKIRANISDRDKIFQDDMVGIILDTYGDYQRAYEIFVNPYGIKADLMRTQNNEDPSFDIIWNSAASINKDGWSAEVAIPFSSLNFANKKEQVWTIALLRILPRASRAQISWLPYDRNNPSLLAQSGELKGIKNIQSGGGVELLPYAMGQKSGYLSNSDNPNSGIKYDPIIGRIGGGIKYSPSANFSIDAVINPDFSQIESDADQISVNTTFALQYEEKRPFFLTGRELLQTPVYYSRSINDPLYAGRILGKSGALTYMYMGAMDRNTIIVVPGEDMSSTVATEKKSLVNIGRLRYDFGDESYIGAILMGRNIEDAHNYSIGFDYNYKFWNNWYIRGEIHLANTKELNDTALFNSDRRLGNTNHTAAFDGENYSGIGLESMLSHDSRSYGFQLEYTDISPAFQVYNGIITSTGYRKIFMNHYYTIYTENSFLERTTFSINGDMRFNFEGTKKEQFVQPGVSFSLKGQTDIYVGYLLVNDEVFFGKDLRGVRRIQFNAQTRPTNEVSFMLSGQVGNFIYRSDDPVVGWGHNISATVQIKPTPQLDVSLSYTRARLGEKDADNLFYDGNIYRAVAIYQFNPEIFVRTILQYNTFSKEIQVYPLFSYKLNAFTKFFAGVTSNYLNYENNYGFRNTDQQYFVKLQYLLGI